MSTALVPLAPSDQKDEAVRSVGRCSVDFIAHLIAAAAHVPQTRSRRRAAPGEASAIYRATKEAPPVGRALSRSL